MSELDLDIPHTCCNQEELDRLRAEVAELRAYKEKAQSFVRNLLATQPEVGFIPFICGHGGEADGNGMHEYLHICAAYGSDAVYIYKRFNSSNPEY